MAVERRPAVYTNLTVSESKAHQRVSRLFNAPCGKFKLQYNETILSLQSYKLVRQCDETVGEGMGWLKVKFTQCKYKERDRRLKGAIHQQWYKRPDIIKELTTMRDSREITIEQVLPLYLVLLMTVLFYDMTKMVQTIVEHCAEHSRYAEKTI